MSESETEQQYKVFPLPGLVIGFQYTGRLASVEENKITPLSAAGISGISDSYKVFSNSPGTGSVLVYFTATGFAHFTSQPVHELLNISTSLDNIFPKSSVDEVENKLARQTTDERRIQMVEQFLLAQLQRIQTDQLVAEAVKLIYHRKGNIKIKALARQLLISQSPFEKRFKKVVGATPKKFASIIRFNAVLDDLATARSLTDICYENNFFDQAHFIKDFRQYTGDTPENFKRTR